MSDENPYQSATAEPALPESRPKSGRVAKVVAGLVILFLLVLLLIPASRSARGPALRAHCLNQMRQLALAMHNYQDTHGALPPAYTVDAEGNPLHSWRTLLLPYLEEQALFESLDLTKPWDDPVNAQLAQLNTDWLLACPSSNTPAGYANYVVVTGPASAFDGPKEMVFSDIADGLGQTIAIVEVDADHAVPWASPKDMTLDEFEAYWVTNASNHPGVTQMAFFDGRARAVSNDLPWEQLRGMLTIAGGEVIEEE